MTNAAPTLPRRPLPWALTVLTAAVLAACGGDDDPAATPAAPVVPASVSVSGTAAVGTPLVGSSVSARCSDNVAVAPGTTDANGRWTLTFGSAASLPCAVEVSGGTAAGAANTQVLHTLASAAGNVNLTPLTDLTLAIAAQALPTAWYAGLGAGHPPTLAGLDAAKARLLDAVSRGGYTLPAATGFDPLTAPFSAATGDAYDGLLDAFARSLAASGTSYSQLLNNVLAAGGGGTLNVPSLGIGTPGTPPAGGNGGGIVLAAKGSIQAADIAPLVGSYAGTFGTTTAPGQAAVAQTTCSIKVQSDGLFSVTAGSTALSARVSGDVGDLILTVNSSIAKAYAYDFSTNTNIGVEVVRGYVVGAVATSPNGNVNCTVSNPHLSSAGSVTVAVLNGATAADFNAALVGEYRSANCAVSVSAGGKLHLVAGSVDMTGTLGGDEQDLTQVFAANGVELFQTTEALADGRTIVLTFSRTAANAALGIPLSYAADVLVDQPRPVQRLASCQSLVKQ